MIKKAFLTTLPDFIEIQRASFCWFLSKGLSEELENFSSIKDVYKLFEFNLFGKEYKLKKPKYEITESKRRNVTYGVKIYVPMSTTAFPKNFEQSVTIRKRKNVLLGELPLMSDRGTFLINGYERVIINQIIRSPGLYYKKEFLKNEKLIYTATLIPNRGSWLKFEINEKNGINVSVDKTDKIEISKFLLIFGLKIDKISKMLSYPNFFDSIEKKEDQDTKKFQNEIIELRKYFITKIFNPKYYEIGKVGRYKLNNRLNLNILNDTHLTIQDIIATINGLIKLYYNKEKSDDIDNLENRRVRSVGELIQTQFRFGLTRLERNLIEKMSICDPNLYKTRSLVNPKLVMGMMREFFNSSQLSQFLDQTNPIAELTHRRRISGLGPGGFSGEHVSFAVRDIHPSHYGRICPIETPEGQNAGLISSLSVYARVNSFGFIETPFFNVKNGIVLKNEGAVYLDSQEEDTMKIAPADTRLMFNREIVNKEITVRYKQDFISILATEVELMAVSSVQIISSATALIPFLEHDDANRALMGANMQRQAVPLLYPTKPIIGTGFESQLASDAGMVIISYNDGYVKTVNSTKIVIKNENGKEIQYDLEKYTRSNQDTCINQRPIIWTGEFVKSGQVIADGPGTEGGEIALGQNITVAYMPWEGYNYEDALLISERLIYSELFTSIHIEKYDLEVKETKGGTEKLTNNLPYVSAETSQNLDSNGIIKKGKFAKAGDILVGKVTPIDEIDIIPEERLLRAIFGEKLPTVKDSSLRVPTGSYGRVLDIRIFSRENNDELLISTESVVRIFLAQVRKLQIGDKMSGRHGNKGIISQILGRQDMPYLPDGKPIDLILNPLGVPSRMNVGQLFEGLFGFAADNLDKRFKILPFDEMFEVEASRILINSSLRSAKNYSKNSWMYTHYTPGKIFLKDGRTGEYFDNPITVCKSYILKLIHLVDDKIHARATGPYSLITQQPLGGKSQQGGQRFGEMEVWALEAFGAAYTLQELLTIKSDDINGRNETLSAIIRGEKIPTPGIPESFKVLILELRALGLDIGMYKIKKNKKNETSEVEINILENSKETDLIPNYKSLEIL